VALQPIPVLEISVDGGTTFHPATFGAPAGAEGDCAGTIHAADRGGRRLVGTVSAATLYIFDRFQMSGPATSNLPAGALLRRHDRDGVSILNPSFDSQCRLISLSESSAGSGNAAAGSANFGYPPIPVSMAEGKVIERV
jgi:hypothetical protein